MHLLKINVILKKLLNCKLLQNLFNIFHSFLYFFSVFFLDIWNTNKKLYIYIYIYIYTHTYIHTYIHARTHTLFFCLLPNLCLLFFMLHLEVSSAVLQRYGSCFYTSLWLLYTIAFFVTICDCEHYFLAAVNNNNNNNHDNVALY